MHKINSMGARVEAERPVWRLWECPDGHGGNTGTMVFEHVDPGSIIIDGFDRVTEPFCASSLSSVRGDNNS